MLENLKKISFAATLALLVAACGIMPLDPCEVDCEADEQALAEQGAVRLGRDEVRAYVSDKTEQWTHGGAYYHDSGKLDVKWRKVNYKTNWEVSVDGTLCYQLETWGRRCHFYMKKGDEVYLLQEGKNIGMRQIYAGNQMNKIKGYAPAPETLGETLRLEQNPIPE